MSCFNFMKYEKLLNLIQEKTDDETHDKIINFIESYEGRGFGGYCGKFAIDLNNFLGGIGIYYGAINTKIWELGDHWIGHVALKINNSLYDNDGEITDLESFKAWGCVDENGNEQELYNLSPEDCYESEIVNLSNLWKEQTEEKILEYTNCNL